MAESQILLAVQPGSDGLALRDRLAVLGFTCEIVGPPGDPAAWAATSPALVLIAPVGPGGASLTARQLEGTPLEGTPILGIGEALAAGRVEADEILPSDASDPFLSSRLNVWLKWGLVARELRELRASGAGARRLDPVTGLPGYETFTSQLDTEVMRHERYGTPVGLILGDISGLRGVNERYGHRTGDMLLNQVGASLRRAVRQVDLVMRYSGDTFAVILPQNGPDATAKAAARLRGLLANLIFRGEPSSGEVAPLLRIAIHIGHASLPDENIRGRGGLLAAAEAALDQERRSHTQHGIPA